MAQIDAVLFFAPVRTAPAQTDKLKPPVESSPWSKIPLIGMPYYKYPASFLLYYWSGFDVNSFARMASDSGSPATQADFVSLTPYVGAVVDYTGAAPIATLYADADSLIDAWTSVSLLFPWQGQGTPYGIKPSSL